MDMKEKIRNALLLSRVLTMPFRHSHPQDEKALHQIAAELGCSSKLLTASNSKRYGVVRINSNVEMDLNLL